MISSVRQINIAAKTLLQITLYKHHSCLVDMIKYFQKILAKMLFTVQCSWFVLSETF